MFPSLSFRFVSVSLVDHSPEFKSIFFLRLVLSCVAGKLVSDRWGLAGFRLTSPRRPLVTGLPWHRLGVTSC